MMRFALADSGLWLMPISVSLCARGEAGNLPIETANHVPSDNPSVNG